MKIVIVGCGKIGTTLIGNLVKEGHDVVAIDKDADTIADVINIYDVIGVCGIGTDVEVLQEAGAGECDLFVAVTGSDEMNMLGCYMAKTIGAENTIARIRDRAYNDKNLGFLQNQLGLTMSINPERFTAYDIYHVLKLPSAMHIETFSARNFEMIEIMLKPDSPLAGTKIMDLRKLYHANFLVCAVGRGEEVIIPDGNFELKGEDKIALCAATNEIIKLLRSLKVTRKQAKSVMILGASRTAYYLAKMLLATGSYVTIIDKDAARCKEIADALPTANVILGDGAQQDLLIEEGLRDVDAFVALTNIDEENILISYFAQSQGVNKVVTKVNRKEFVPMAAKLGLDTIVSPKHTIARVVVRFARAMQNSVGSKVEKLYRIMEDNAEALQFDVSADFKHVNIPLKNIKFKKNVLIAGILRNRKGIVPTGDDVIMPGDKVIVISTGQILCDLADIIA